MSAQTKAVNHFFSTACRADVEKILSLVVLSERQEQIFSMFYLKKKDVNFIADKLNYSPDTINKELRKIRNKISFFMPF